MHAHSLCNFSIGKIYPSDKKSVENQNPGKFMQCLLCGRKGGKMKKILCAFNASSIAHYIGSDLLGEPLNDHMGASGARRLLKDAHMTWKSHTRLQIPIYLHPKALRVCTISAPH